MSGGIEIPGAQQWAQRYDGPAGSFDYAYSLGVSPDGAWVYVTGSSYECCPEPEIADYATVAYDASTGAQRWVARYEGAEPHSFDDAYSLGVSPDGTALFVTGGSNGAYATVAYEAKTGNQLWASRFQGTTKAGGAAYSLDVSPDGKAVYVTGILVLRGSFDLVTVAYDASNGARLWAARYDGPAHSTDTGVSIDVDPDGSRVYVTGESYGAGPTPPKNFVTIAYDAASGIPAWTRRTGQITWGEESPGSLKVSPNGDRVFVSGSIRQAPSFAADYLTICYDALTGTQLWKRQFDGPANGWDSARSLVVDPSGATVYVTGSASFGGFYTNYSTVAYDASSGAQLWVSDYDGPSSFDDIAYALQVSADGNVVYVTGDSEHDYTTVAYGAADGAEQWVARYDSPANGDDRAYAVAESPLGGTVFITGRSDADYATVAYATR